MIFEKAVVVDPYDSRCLRAYTLVILCLNTGSRNKEIRLVEVRNINATQ